MTRLHEPPSVSPLPLLGLLSAAGVLLCRLVLLVLLQGLANPFSGASRVPGAPFTGPPRGKRDSQQPHLPGAPMRLIRQARSNWWCSNKQPELLKQEEVSGVSKCGLPPPHIRSAWITASRVLSPSCVNHKLMGGLRLTEEAETEDEDPSSLFSEEPGDPATGKSSRGAFSNWTVLPTPPIFSLGEPMLQQGLLGDPAAGLGGQCAPDDPKDPY
ncbi:hypothetical protein EPH_0052010 [Eimeria praecox]|uniref:Uncharacterized protein n=1 Tax=Eimeria praecox TaxID=51316 RepID=U6H2Z0_9EIME|nr:hypothetical protein EPH_0052010 [Eimeria praecox]